LQTIRWGIIGPGHIALSFTNALKGVVGAQCHSVLSRSIDRAQNFCDEYGFTVAYSDITKFLDDPELDVVYIATPHSEHYSQSIQALTAGKAVLCEKPITVNLKQAEQLLAVADQSGSFFMEAVWTRCLPVYQHITQWLSNGEIGEVKMIQASFGINRTYDPSSRLYDPAQAGGALLDVGIYPLTLCDIVMQQLPAQVLALAQLAPNRVDQNLAIALKYDTGAIVQLGAGIGVETDHSAWIYGDEGRILIEPRFWCSEGAKLFANGAKEPRIVCDTPHRINGYEYEIEEVHQCLAQGQGESERVPHTTSLRMMQLMDEIRRQVGVNYACD
jgi:predicted dehydrogenase